MILIGGNILVRELAKQQSSYMISLRREFHRHPELSFQEEWTSNRIQQELSKLNIPFEIIGEYGVLATIEGQTTNTMLALRADMDALPIQEENKHLDYMSQTPNVMHACGHDAHISMLLGAASILSQLKGKLKGSVKLCFQQAEEVGGGASEILQALDSFPIKTTLGIHIWSELPAGKVSITPGYRMSGGTSWKVVFKGRGTHGAIPEEGISPLIVAAAFVLNLNSCWAYEFSPLENVAGTTGILRSGTAANIIPEEAEVAGVHRTFTPEQYEKFNSLIKRVAENTAATYRAKATVFFEKGIPPVYNDPEYCMLAQKSALALADENILDEFHPLMPSENFGYYTKKYRGLMAFVGAGNASKGCTYPHHHPCFNIDEDAMVLGAGLYAQYALDFFNNYK
ncbi:MAG: M20 metallopeptidase family protein [Brevinema sp.]